MPTDPITDAINRVGQDVRDLRVDLTGRLDAMVTRREHDAETRRLDAEIKTNRAAHEQVRKALEDHEVEATKQWRSVAEQINEAEQRRQDAQAAAIERRKADRRFIALWASGAVAAAVAAASLITQWIGG